MAGERPLKALADEFRNLAANGQELRVDSFARACAPINLLIRSLGPLLRAVEDDFSAKVNDIDGASQTFATLAEMMDADVQAGTVTVIRSHTRNLLRVYRALVMLRVLLTHMIDNPQEDSMINAALAAYNQVFAPYHPDDVQSILTFGVAALPTRTAIIGMLNEDGNSATIQMQTYVAASEAVINYVGNLFVVRGLSLDT